VRAGDYVAPLVERPFRLLWLGRTASSIGDALIPVALAFAVLDVGGGATGLGFVFASFTIGRAAFVVVGGVWSDRLPRRAVMVAADVIRFAIDAFTAVALLTGEMRLWMFLVTAGSFGAASAFFGPASTGLVPQTISAPHLQQANALLSFSQTATNVFGPAVSGLIVTFANPGWVFAIDAASFLASAAFLLALELPSQLRAPAQRFFHEVKEGWQEIRSRKWLWTSFIAFAIGNIGIGPFFVLGPLIARDHLGGAQAWGFILTGGALGGVAGSILAYRIRPGRPLLVCFSTWLLAALPPLAMLPPLPVVAIAVASAAFSLGIVFGNGIWETVLQREIPLDKLSRVGSIDWMVSLVFVPVGNALAGPFSDWFGLRTTLLVAAGLLIAADGGLLLLVPDVRNFRVARPSPAPSASAAGESPVPAPPGPLP
jgi:MFS family permease